MRTIEKTVYLFDELTEEAKEKARDWFKTDYPDHDWWDSVYEDFQNIAKILGFDIAEKRTGQRRDGSIVYGPCIYFSGFWSQGDGASFEARYSYAAGWGKALEGYAPKDSELFSIGERLQALQKPYFYRACMKIETRGHYSHANTMQSVSFYRKGDYDYLQIMGKDSDQSERDFLECARDLANWLYSTLEKEYEHLLSDDSVDENIRINEYEFYQDGRRACV